MYIANRKTCYFIMTAVKIYMFVANLISIIVSILYIFYSIQDPAVTEKAEMYNNGPRSLGRRQQSGPRLPFLYFMREMNQRNWLENQLLQGWAEREKSGPRSLGRDHQSGSRSLDRDHPGLRSHVSVLNSFRGYSNNFRKTFLNWLLHPLLIFFTTIFRPFTCGWRD